MTTTVGIHRDDIAITIDGKEARTFASQGQQRSAVLSLKLAQLELAGAESGEAPILMLDERWYCPGRWPRWPWLAMSWAPPRCCFWTT